jgi:hypothetical protein
MGSPERARTAGDRAPHEGAWQDLPDRVPVENLVEELSADAVPELLPDFLRIHYTGGFNGPGSPAG